MQTCTQRSSPAGQCVIQQNDLLPGQQAVGRVFAVPAASTDCFPYSYELMRVCRSDRTFATGTIYSSCEVRPVSRDADGCAKLPGYNFYRGWLLSDAANWRVDDGTHWGRVEAGADALALAARDMLLMAARCSALDACAAFQNTGNSTDLLYQLPLPSSWVRAPDTADYCTGIYAKSAPSTACPRIPGYLFTSLLTLDVASANGSIASSGFFPAVGVGAGPCGSCSDATALAVRCDGYSRSSGGGGSGGCAGFSNYHGLILASDSGSGTNGGVGSSGGSGLLTDAPLVPFTSTPCAGLFMRASRVFPTEVEELDKLLCGELVYCTARLRYHAAGTSSAALSGSGSGSSSSGSGAYYVDISVDVLSDLALPRGLLDVSGGGLRPLPSVRSLVVRCQGGAALLGGLPVGLVALTPVLQELRVVGCGVAGSLPAELAQLRYLRVLDLSANRLGGTLPEAWASMSLGYLNLSSNLLTGTLPPSWSGILSPPPPPPITLAAAAAAAQMSPPPPPPSGGAGSMLVADLSGNGLGGAIPRDYVEAACVRHRLRMQLQGQPSAELVAALGTGGSGRPTFLLQFNPGITAWAGRYDFAVSDLGGDLHGGGDNLCGADRYKIALGVVWGVFGVCLLAICGYSIAAAVQEARRLGARRRRGHGFMTEADLALAAQGAGAADVSDADSTDGADGAGANCADCKGSSGGGAAAAARLRALAERLWARRWVRRLTLLARLGYLTADVALDIRVTVWLFADGDGGASAVCLAFIVVTQAAVSAALWGSLAHHLFESRLLVAAIYPALLAAGPLVGPVLAVANIRNSDVPVVFWRYLELVEFCVALLQAPAEAVTQSVVYAQQNLMGGGMYLDHALFLASVLLSLGDILIAAWKLCRYKRGPLRRVLVAITHLDKVRDPVDYRKRLREPRRSRKDGASTGGVSGLHLLETPLNPAGGGLGRSSRGGSDAGAVGPSREGSRERLPMLGPATSSAGGAGGGGGGLAAGSSTTVDSDAQHPCASSSTGVIGLELHPVEQGTAAASALEDTAASGVGGGGAAAAAPAAMAAAAAAHTYTPLTPSRYRPSLLAASASRLGGGAAGPGGSIVVGPSHSPPVPSRLGPPPGSSSSSRGSVTIPAHPPLRPLLPSLPSTPPHPPSRSGTDAEGDSASPTTHTSSRPSGPAATALAAAAADAARHQGTGTAASTGPSSSGAPHAGGGAAGGGSLSRRSRSVQEPLPQPALDALGPSLVGTLSSDIVGLAATGGHGPPRPHKAGEPTPASGGPPHSRPSSRRPSNAGGGGGPAPDGEAGARHPPRSLPSGPFQPDLQSGYLSSAAAAAEAALAEPPRSSDVGAAGTGPSTAPSPDGPAPAGLVLSPPSRWDAGGPPAQSQAAASQAPGDQRPLRLRSSGPGGSSLRQVASIREAAAAGGGQDGGPHSAGASPARRRGEALSIAVPASPVHESGIEVIRMSRTSSARQASPSGSSRGATTPSASVRLPPPPHPPPWFTPGAPPIPPRPPRPPEG